MRNYNLGLFGTLVKDKVSFNLFVNGMDSYDTANINAALVERDTLGSVACAHAAR